MSAPMAPLEGQEFLPRPELQAELVLPEDGWQEQVWVKQNAAGVSTVMVLWAWLVDEGVGV